jgi:hypothetical protein
MVLWIADQIFKILVQMSIHTKGMKMFYEL